MSVEREAELQAKLERVSAELAVSLKRIQTLEIALQANRGDWFPPNHIRVWTDSQIEELKGLTGETRDYIFSRGALNDLQHLADAATVLGFTPGSWCLLPLEVAEMKRKLARHEAAPQTSEQKEAK